jgi:hypothetical protein
MRKYKNGYIVRLPARYRNAGFSCILWYAMHKFLCGQEPKADYSEVIKGKRVFTYLKISDETENLLKKCLKAGIYENTTQVLTMAHRYIEELPLTIQNSLKGE